MRVAKNLEKRAAEKPMLRSRRCARRRLGKDEVARQRDELAVQIMDEVQSLVSNIRPELIVITGGGAALLRRELVKIHPRLTHHPNPRYANAIGFYRAAVARGRGNAES